MLQSIMTTNVHISSDSETTDVTIIPSPEKKRKGRGKTTGLSTQKKRKENDNGKLKVIIPPDRTVVVGPGAKDFVTELSVKVLHNARHDVKNWKGVPDLAKNRIVAYMLPIFIPPYRMAPTKFKELKEELKDFLDKGYIRSNISPWGAPVMFFPLELWDSKIQEFINKKQNDISVNDYALKFTQLSKYAPVIVDVTRACMRKFMSSFSNDVVKSCKTFMLIKEIDTYKLVTYAQQIEVEKMKEREETIRGLGPVTLPKEDQWDRASGSMSEGTVTGGCTLQVFKMCGKDIGLELLPVLLEKFTASCIFYYCSTTKIQEDQWERASGSMSQGHPTQQGASSCNVGGQRQNELVPEYLPGVLLEWEIGFRIDLFLETQPILIPPDEMALDELYELKEDFKDLLHKGFIGPSISPWGAPMFFLVPKFKSDQQDISSSSKSQGTLTSQCTHPMSEKYGKNQQGQKVQLIIDRLKRTKSNKMSYADVRRMDLEFKIDDSIFLKVSHMKEDMSTRRTYARRIAGENVEQEAPPQAPVATVDLFVEKVTNVEFRAAFQVLSQSMTAQVNREVVSSVNANAGRTISRVMYFTRMNPLEFHGSKALFNQRKEGRALYTGPLDWEKFKVAFLERFFPLEMREEKVLEFINLRQGSMSVKEYALNSHNCPDMLLLWCHDQGIPPRYDKAYKTLRSLIQSL
ncbi:hypothetical protein MTR67_023012 [Solanum verrucosum]|uniref:Retrotransposon gag domain-containing protein n=1 Tax=Solanum verrucosum TaxID=315347 RepID=A0AAF0QVY8_SOLVR|nr:hypothetical protein MTR67_023012 [Solanum verrucosum]